VGNRNLSKVIRKPRAAVSVGTGRHRKAQEGTEATVMDEKFRANELSAEQASEQLNQLFKRGGTQ